MTPIEQAIEALEAFNLKEDMIVSGTSDSLLLRVPLAAIQKGAAALAALRGQGDDAKRLAQPQGELVAYRFDWPAEAGVGMRRFAGADDPFVEQQRKWGVAKIVPLYTEPPQSADRQDFDRRLALQKASYEREIAIEAAADRELLEQALEALESCSEGGYRDIDGDWCERLHYDKSKVAASLAAIRERLGEGEKT
jgi:hypothetical protein